MSGHLSVCDVCQGGHLAHHFSWLTELFWSCFWQSLTWLCWSIMGRRRSYISLIRWKIALTTPLSLTLRPLILLGRQRGASAVEHGQWGYGINVYGKRRRYQPKATEKSTLKCSDVWVPVWWGICQGAGLPPKPWQLSAGSSEYLPLFLGQGDHHWRWFPS